MIALVTLALLATRPAPIDATFTTALRGQPIGLVRVRFDGERYSYESLTVVMRGATRTTIRFTATTDAGGVGTTSTGALLRGPMPSTLALWRFADGDAERCIPVEDERDGKPGQVCGTRRGEQVEGTLLGEPFRARITEAGLQSLELTREQARFERIQGEIAIPTPPDLFAGSVNAGVLATLASKTRARIRGSGSGCALDLDLTSDAPAHDEPLGPRSAGRWEQEARSLSLGTSTRWATARALTHFVEQAIAPATSSPASEDAAQVWRDRRGSCLGQAQLFAALARGSGLPARVVFGALLEEGTLSGHAWDEVEVGGVWFGVDPSRGAAPVGLDHLPMAREGDPDPLRAGRCLLALPTIRWTVEADPPRRR